MTLDAILSALRPELADCARRHIEMAKAHGIASTILSTGGYRSAADQIALYGKGRDCVDGAWVVVEPAAVVTHALPEHAPHCRAAAYDLVVVTAGQPDWNDLGAYQRLGEIGEGLGLVWGGRFTKLKDMPHFELPGWRDLPMPDAD